MYSVVFDWFAQILVPHKRRNVCPISVGFSCLKLSSGETVFIRSMPPQKVYCATSFAKLFCICLMSLKPQFQSFTNESEAQVPISVPPKIPSVLLHLTIDQEAPNYFTKEVLWLFHYMHCVVFKWEASNTSFKSWCPLNFKKSTVPRVSQNCLAFDKRSWGPWFLH